MANANTNPLNDEDNLPPEQQPPPTNQAFHRLGQARTAKGVSPRDLAQRLNATINQVLTQEEATSDICLSAIYRWAAALGVPVTELLVDSEPAVQLTPVRLEQAMRLLETAKAIRQQARRPALQRLAQTLIDQLAEMAPDLSRAAAASAAVRRRAGPSGSSGKRPLPESMFLDEENEP